MAHIEGPVKAILWCEYLGGWTWYGAGVGGRPEYSGLVWTRSVRMAGPIHGSCTDPRSCAKAAEPSAGEIDSEGMRVRALKAVSSLRDQRAAFSPSQSSTGR